MFNHGFLVIAFMGVDGSGKSTMINALKKKLKTKFSKIRYLHLRPYLFLLDKRTVVKNPHQISRTNYKFINFFRILIWLFMYRLYFKFLSFQKKELILFDRYVHDILIDNVRYNFNLSKNFMSKILELFPKPDLWVYLNAPKHILNKRKQELSKDELCKQIKKYDFFFKKETSLLKLNTQKNIQNNLSLIVSKINSISKRN